MRKRNEYKVDPSLQHKSIDKSSQTSFLIQDERESNESGQTFIGYFHPLETRTLDDLYSKIYSVVGIPVEDRDGTHIIFKVNNEKVEIHYPSELIGSDGIIAILTNHDSSNRLNDSAETDKSKYIEEHANHMPHSSGQQIHNLVIFSKTYRKKRRVLYLISQQK